MQTLAQRYGWKWLQEPEDLWRKRYPRITKKMDDIEARLKQLEDNGTTKW